MKNIIICLLALVCMLSTQYHDARANGVTDIEYHDARGRVSVVVLAPISIKIRTVIRDQFAITTITQQFRIDDSIRVRRFGMPLSEARSVTGFRYRIDTANWRVATIGRKDTAKGSSGTGGTGAPALPPSSQFTGYIKQSGFYYEFLDSLSGNHVLEMECTMMELLPLRRGSFSYQVPFEHMPSYGVQRAIWSLSLTSSTALTDVYLPLSITGTRQDTSDLLVVEPEIATGVAILSYRLRRDNVAAVVLSAKPRGEDGYALLFATPGGDTTVAAMPRRFTIVLDVSGSMSGEKLAQAKEGAQKCFDQLVAGDEFNVILFDHGVGSLWRYHKPVTPGNINEARRYIDAARASGGTNLQEALISTFSMYRDTSAVNLAVFLTDGQASVNRPYVSASNAMKVRLLVIGVGSDVDAQLLNAIAFDHRGQYFPVTTIATLGAAIASIAESTRMPMLKNPTMSCAPDVLYDVAPAVLPDIFMNEQFSIAARYRQPGDVVTTIVGNGAQGQQQLVIQGTLADNDTLAPYVPKIWAKMRIDLLITLMSGITRNSRLWNEYRDEIIALGVKFGLVTPYTAFTGVSDGPTHVSDNEQSDMSTCATCARVSPNPVRTSTTIQTAFVQAHEFVRVILLGVNGEVLFDELVAGCAGGEWTYTLSLDRLPAGIASGAYILQLSAGEESRTVTIHVVR